jgi:hypothetical protein
MWLSNYKTQDVGMEKYQSNRVIFLSVSHILTKDQETFVSNVERIVRKHNYDLKTVGRGVEKSLNVSKDVKELIDKSSGAIVIATKRLFLSSGLEYETSDARKEIHDRYYPSAWLQIEGAMALQQGQSLLLLREEGLYQEGIFRPSFLPSVSFVPPELSPEVELSLIQWINTL